MAFNLKKAIFLFAFYISFSLASTASPIENL